MTMGPWNVVTPQPQGPPGPAPKTTLATSFTIPVVGDSNPTTLAPPYSWVIRGQQLLITGAGVFEVAAVSLTTGAVSLTNLGADGNEAAGIVVASGTDVGVSGIQGTSGSPGPQGPSADVGFSRDASGAAVIISPGLKQVASTLSDAFDAAQPSWTALTTDAPTVIYVLDDGALITRESARLFVMVIFLCDDGNTPYSGCRTLRAEGINIGGTIVSGPQPFFFTDLTGAGEDQTGASAAIVTASGPTLAVQVTRPAGRACHAIAYTSRLRVKPPNATVLTSISPNSGPLAGGTPVMITASSGLAGATAVTVGGVPLAPGWEPVSDTEILGVTGEGATLGISDVVVTVGSNPYTLSGAFTYTPNVVPSFTSIFPNNGFLQGGQAVQIRGGAYTGASAVSLDGVPVASFVAAPGGDDTLINAVAAPGVVVGTGVVSVTNAIGPNSGLAFSYTPNPPTFGTLAPTHTTVSVPAALTLAGTNFLPATDAGVKIGATKYSMGGSMTINSLGTQIAGVVDPAAVGKGNVYVTIGGIDYLGPTFWSTSAAAPSITSLTPNNGAYNGGTSVAIVGTGLTGLDIPSLGAVTTSDGTHSPITAASVVYVDDAHASFVTGSDSPNSGAGVCSITTPAGAGTKPWTYNTPPPPTVTAFQQTAKAGDTITVRGTGFSVSTPTVKWNTTPATTLNVLSDTAVSVVVPALTASGTAYSLTVQTLGGTSAGQSFYCLPSTATFAWYSHADNETIAAGAVSAWKDTTAAINVAQAVGASQPADSVAAFSTGARSVHFSGAQSLLYSGGTLPGLGTSPFTVVAVIKAAGPAYGSLGIFAASFGGVWTGLQSPSDVSAGNTSSLNNTGWAGGAHMVTAINQATGSVAIDNGTPVTGALGTTAFTGGIVFGADGPSGTTFPFTGDIGLYIVAAGVLSGADLAIIHAISQAIYGTP